MCGSQEVGRVPPSRDGGYLSLHKTYSKRCPWLSYTSDTFTKHKTLGAGVDFVKREAAKEVDKLLNSFFNRNA